MSLLAPCWGRGRKGWREAGWEGITAGRINTWINNNKRQIQPSLQSNLAVPRCSIFIFIYLFNYFKFKLTWSCWKGEKKRITCLRNIGLSSKLAAKCMWQMSAFRVYSPHSAGLWQGRSCSVCLCMWWV